MLEANDPEMPMLIPFNPTPLLPEPIEPGADIGLKVLAPAGRAGLAPQLSEDTPHRFAAGQEHGVDQRGQGLGLRNALGHLGLPGPGAIGVGPRLPNGLLRVEGPEGIVRRNADAVIGGQALEHDGVCADLEDLDGSPGEGEVATPNPGVRDGHRLRSLPLQGGDLRAVVLLPSYFQGHDGI